MAAGALGATPAALIWNFRVRLIPAPRKAAIPPDFAAPGKTPPPLPHPDTEPQPQIRERLVHFWRATPAWIRSLAVSGSAAAILWPGVSRLSRSAPAREANQAIESRIRQRAAIEIQDDFRSGLSQWAGAPNWAASWAYDATGFARPGRLALLSSSLPLTDYRLEFLAQIDKKALGWVFRATDERNYYATKLVESRRGVAAVFFIVRYAVIDGQQRLRVQLPLPVTGSAETMFRVREEVRGSQFTTYLDGRVIDTWSDSSFTRGGVGFFSDSGEVAYIRWVEVAQQDDVLGRLCSYLASSNQDQK